MAIRLADDTRDPMVNACVDLIDAGAGAGTLKIRTGPQPADADDAATGTLLVTITLPDPAFGASAAGTATAGAITPVAAAATGTAGWFRVEDSDANTVFDGNVTATGGGGDLELNTTSLVASENVTISAFTFTVPAG